MSDKPNDTARAEQEIVQATHRYARGLDRFDPQEALSAFSVDAVWDATAVGLERFEGREEIRKFFERDAEVMANQVHIVTNHIVEFDSADRAHGSNYVFAEGETASGAKIRAIALNEDQYLRTPNGWQISSRLISPLTPPSMEGFDA